MGTHPHKLKVISHNEPPWCCFSFCLSHLAEGSAAARARERRAGAAAAGGGVDLRSLRPLPARRGGGFVFFPNSWKLGLSLDRLAVVRGGPEVRFHEGCTRVQRGFNEVLQGLWGAASTKKSTACCWGAYFSVSPKSISIYYCSSGERMAFHRLALLDGVGVAGGWGGRASRKPSEGCACFSRKHGRHARPARWPFLRSWPRSSALGGLI